MSLVDSFNNFVDNTFGTDVGGNNPGGSSGLGNLLSWTADRTGMHNGGDFLNAGLQYLTFGLLGYDSKSGSLQEGVTTHAADETIGELTGRNTARAQLHLAQNEFEYSKQQAAALLAQQQFQNERADVSASQQAAALTSTGLATSGINPSNATPTAYGPGSQTLGSSGYGKDFLGL